MTETTTSAADRGRAVIEEYGMVFVGVTLAVFAVEMIALVTVISFGVDIEPVLAWIRNTLGWDIGENAQTAGTFALAYAITRVVKPLTFAFTLVLTPVVANLLPKRD